MQKINPFLAAIRDGVLIVAAFCAIVAMATYAGSVSVGGVIVTTEAVSKAEPFTPVINAKYGELPAHSLGSVSLLMAPKR